MQNKIKSNLFIWISFTIIAAIIIGGVGLYYYFTFDQNTLVNREKIYVSGLGNKNKNDMYQFTTQTDLTNKIIYWTRVDEKKDNATGRTIDIKGIFAMDNKHNQSTEILQVGSVGNFPIKIILDEKNKLIYVNFEHSIYLFDLIKQKAQKIFPLTEEKIDKTSGEIDNITLSSDKKKMAIEKSNFALNNTGDTIEEIYLLDLTTLESQFLFSNNNQKTDILYYLDDWIDNNNLRLLGGSFFAIRDGIYNLNINTGKVDKTDFVDFETSHSFLFSNNGKCYVSSKHIDKLDNQTSYGSCYEMGGDCHEDAIIFDCQYDNKSHLIKYDYDYQFQPVIWSNDDKKILYYTKKVEITDGWDVNYIDGSEEYYIYNLDDETIIKTDNWVDQLLKWYPNYTSSPEDNFQIIKGNLILDEKPNYLGYIQ